MSSRSSVAAPGPRIGGPGATTLVLLMVCMLAAAGCGQKGPLTLPKAAAPVAASAPASGASPSASPAPAATR